jgi:hypothetical protein
LEKHRSVVGAWTASLLLDLAPPGFAIKPPTLRALGRLGSSTLPFDVECRSKLVRQALLGEATVPQLRTFVIGNHTHHRAEELQDPLALRLMTEGRRRGHMERQLNSGGRLVCMLTTRSTGGTERLQQLESRDAHGIGDDQTIVFATLSRSAHRTIMLGRRTEPIAGCCSTV